MLPPGVGHRIAIGIHLDISADIAPLLLDCDGDDVHMGVRLCLVKVYLEPDDAFSAIAMTDEAVCVERPLLDVSHAAHMPVVPGCRVPLIVNLLVAECQQLHTVGAARQDEFDVCVLLVGGTGLVLLEIEFLQ